MSTHTETGGLVADRDEEVREARAQLRLAAQDDARGRFDDLLGRIRDARDAAAPGTFRRADYQRLLDEALGRRRRFFPEAGA